MQPTARTPPLRASLATAIVRIGERHFHARAIIHATDRDGPAVLTRGRIWSQPTKRLPGGSKRITGSVELPDDSVLDIMVVDLRPKIFGVTDVIDSIEMGFLLPLELANTPKNIQLICQCAYLERLIFFLKLPGPTCNLKHAH